MFGLLIHNWWENISRIHQLNAYKHTSNTSKYINETQQVAYWAQEIVAIIYPSINVDPDTLEILIMKHRKRQNMSSADALASNQAI